MIRIYLYNMCVHVQTCILLYRTLSNIIKYYIDISYVIICNNYDINLRITIVYIYMFVYYCIIRGQYGVLHEGIDFSWYFRTQSGGAAMHTESLHRRGV